MKDLAVTVFGAVTSLITAMLLFAIEKAFDFSLYTWTFWFVVPAGALISGFAAASGYALGARLLNRRPGRVLLVSILGVSVATFFVIHYLSYHGLSIDGAPIRERVSFGQYLNVMLTQTSLTFRFHASKLGSTGTLGLWGYLYGLLQVLGFAAGGFAVYAYLRELPFCDACSRYLKRASRTQRFTTGQESLRTLMDTIEPLLNEGRISEIVARHGRFGDAKAVKTHDLRTQLELWRCETCTEKRVRFGVARRSGNEWKDIDELKREATSHATLVTEGAT